MLLPRRTYRNTHTSAHHTFVSEKHAMNSSPLHLTQPQFPVHGPINVQSQSTDRLEPEAPGCIPGRSLQTQTPLRQEMTHVPLRLSESLELPRWCLMWPRPQNFQDSSLKAKPRRTQGLHGGFSSAITCERVFEKRREPSWYGGSCWGSLEGGKECVRGQCISQTGGGQLLPMADVYISPTTHPLVMQRERGGGRESEREAWSRQKMRCSQDGDVACEFARD